MPLVWLGLGIVRYCSVRMLVNDGTAFIFGGRKMKEQRKDGELLTSSGNVPMSIKKKKFWVFCFFFFTRKIFDFSL